MPMVPAVDIRQELRALLDKFEVEYESVICLIVRPGEAEVKVQRLRRNDGGSFFIDEATGDAATAVMTYAVKT